MGPAKSVCTISKGFVALASSQFNSIQAFHSLPLHEIKPFLLRKRKYTSPTLYNVTKMESPQKISTQRKVLFSCDVFVATAPIMIELLCITKLSLEWVHINQLRYLIETEL